MGMKATLRRIGQHWDLYLILLPTLLYFVIFHYVPMYGAQLAFKDYRAVDGIWGSPWVGLRNFVRFFNSYQAWPLIRNTIVVSLYGLAAGFPFPILLAVLLNHLPSRRYRRIIQTTIYAPHFISTVVLVGLMFNFLSPRSGVVNHILQLFGGKSIFFMAESGWFRHLFVFSGIWQNAGWGSIIYLAALSAVDPTLYEAADMDGATKLQKIMHIDIPSILPTAVVLLVLNFGQIMNIGFEKAFLMQTASNLATSEVLATYVYKVGLVNAQFGFSTAVGLFNSLVNLALLLTVNRVAKALGSSGLW
jgi:putative aldouronate transport system permease protein